MSNPHARRLGELPPTPSRSFSHPNHQCASSLSPEHNQDNPPVAANDSRYMLPILPSRAFSRSTSDVSLRTEQDRHADFDFGYEPRARLGTPHTAFSTYSVPDMHATALPPMPIFEAPPVPQIPQQFGGPAASTPVTINPPSPRRSIRRPPPLPTKNVKSGKGNRWGKWSMKVKTAFRFRRYKKAPVPDVPEPAAPVMEIGEPSGFRHVSSDTGKELRASDTGLFASLVPRIPIPGGVGGTSMMMSGGIGGGDLGQRSNMSHGAGPGAAGADSSRGNTYSRLGHQDVDDTAVSDDGDSDWEDQEATQIFRAWNKSLNGRH